MHPFRTRRIIHHPVEHPLTDNWFVLRDLTRPNAKRPAYRLLEEKVISIKKLGKIRHGKGAEHGVLFKGSPVGHPGLLSGAVLHGLLKGNGKQGVYPFSFLRSRLANDHRFPPPNTGQILFSEADSCSRPLRRTR